MINLNIHISVDNENLAQGIVDNLDDPEAVLAFLLKCDELVDDLTFTEELRTRLGARWILRDPE